MLRLPILVLAAVLVAAVPVFSEDPAPEEEVPSACVKRLGSDDAEVRKVAYATLRKMRRKATEALKDGTHSTDAETAGACRELLEIIDRSSMSLEGGPIDGIDWWKARDLKFTANFRETPLSEIFAAAKEDLGFRIRAQPSTANLGSRKVTGKFDGAPLEFALEWLLFMSLEGGSNGSPRLGWTGKEAILSCEQRPAGEAFPVKFEKDGALAGIPARDAKALSRFIEEIGKSEGNPASVRASDYGLEVKASPFTQVEAARLIDDFRRNAAGAPLPGAALDAAQRDAGKTLVSVSWTQVPVEDALQELGEKTGGRWCLDRRSSQWGGNFDAWYSSQHEEPASVVGKAIAERWPTARLEQKWGAWWIFVDPGNQGQEMVVRPAGSFVRRMMMTDATWQPGGIETWLKSRKMGNAWSNAGTTAIEYFPDTARIAIYGSRAMTDALDGLLASRAREGESRLARLEGRVPETPAQISPEEVGRRIGNQLAKEKIARQMESSAFDVNAIFQEAFKSLHDSLTVNSTSGSLNGRGPGDHAIRACRLKDVSSRVVWEWLNEGSLQWFLDYYPDQKSAKWGIGMSNAWDSPAPAPGLNRARVHPAFEKDIEEFLAGWDKEAKKAYLDEPAMPGEPDRGPVRLPRSPSAQFFAATGLDPGAAAAGREPDGTAPASLDVNVNWPAGELTIEEALFKVGELAEISFVFDVPNGAGPTRKVKYDAASRTPRSVLDQAAEAAGLRWRVGTEGVIWVAARRSEKTEWAWIDGSVVLGAEEAAAVVAEFAKTGDTLYCLGPTGRFAARCAHDRAATVHAAFEKAKADAREAARADAAALEADAAAGKPLPAGLPAALALEKAVASTGSRELAFALARRIAAGGHARAALRRFTEVAEVVDDPALSARANAAAAAQAVLFGPSDPGMDAEAVRMAEAALQQPDLPKESAAEALGAEAEAWRRAGDRDRALECYRRIGELGMDTELTKAWRARLEGLPEGQ